MARQGKTKKASKSSRPCDFPGCRESGAFRAPQDRTLRHFYWFCQKHAAEYNKNWDFLKGLSPDEIENHLRHDTTWQRPTWKLGEGPMKGNPKIRDRSTIYEDLGIGGTSTPPPARESPFETKLIQALDFMGLNAPVTTAQVKKQFKTLAKKYHPDAGASGTAQRFHQLVEAYAYLMNRLNK